MIKKLKRKYLQGRLTNICDWENRIKKICQKWLIKTPVVPKTDSRQSVFSKFFRKNGKQSIQVWQFGSLYIALNESGFFTNKEDDYTILIEKQFDLKIIKDADYGLLLFALMDRIDFSTEINSMISYIKDDISEEGVILYKSYVKNVAFVDTLGFVCPFLIKYGLKNHDESYIELAKHQIKWYIKNGTEKHCELPFHAVRLTDKTTLGICDWARGLCWLLIALMDGYIILKDNNREDEYLEEQIIKYANILCSLQKSSGAYSWQLLSNKDSDSSATAVFGWYLACCYRLFKKKQYLNIAQKCRNYLMSITFNSGVIDYCQGDTISIGMYSRRFDKMPFAQAFTLRMQNELKNINKNFYA